MATASPCGISASRSSRASSPAFSAPTAAGSRRRCGSSSASTPPPRGGAGARAPLPRDPRSRAGDRGDARGPRPSTAAARRAPTCAASPPLTPSRGAGAAQRHRYSPIDTALIGWHLSGLAIGVLGILVICGEYSTGMIRSTFMAAPTRLPVLWAKVLVFATVTLVLTFPMTFIGFFAASAVLHRHVAVSLSAQDSLRCVIAVPLFLTVLAVFTVALGQLVRNIAGGIAVFAGIIFVIPGVVGVLSNSLKNAINPCLPSNAASAEFTARPDPDRHLLRPWTGFGVFCAYAAVLLVAATITLVRRDV